MHHDGFILEVDKAEDPDKAGMSQETRLNGVKANDGDNKFQIPSASASAFCDLLNSVSGTLPFDHFDTCDIAGTALRGNR